MVQLNEAFDNRRAGQILRTVQPGGKYESMLPTGPAPLPILGPGLGTVASSSASHALLSLLSRLFSPLRSSQHFTPTLQKVKGLLYNKEYLAAFGTTGEDGEAMREAYVCRYTPARAVIYERIFDECNLTEALGWSFASRDREQSEEDALRREREEARRRREWKREGKSQEEVLQLEREHRAAEEEEKKKEEEQGAEEYGVLMIGAGAGGEVVALGAALAAVAAAETDVVRRRPRIKVDVVDQGSWGGLLEKMNEGMKAEWPSLAASENAAIGGGFEVSFRQGDVLAAPSSASATSSSSDPSTTPLDLTPSPSLRLITIHFTISELLLQSRPRTLRLLSSFSTCAPGTLLLIVESAALALVPLGSEGRTYPLGQLLDHALTGAVKQAEGNGSWERVQGEEGKWYRQGPGNHEAYNPARSGLTEVKLENSRVLLRLYRKK